MIRGKGFHNRHSPVGSFSPLSLFATGSQGVWFDPSDSTTLFTTSAGTTPCAAPGAGAQVLVGRMLDKSGNGNHANAVNNTTGRPELSARVNLLTATATLSTQSITTVATNYTLYFTGSGSITLSGTASGVYNAGTHTITCTAGTLTLTVSGSVTTADFRPANFGALLPVYQEVTSTYSYDSNGFPRYLMFNGSSLSMATPANLNLSSTDKATVFAGLRKLSDAATGIATELSAAASSNNGSFAIFNASGGARYNSILQGTATLTTTYTTFAAPITNVAAYSYNIAGAASSNEVSARFNGITTAPSSTSGANAGTGNFGSYPLYIGSRANSSLWFNGYLYSLIVVGATSTAGEISSTEQWMAGKTGLQF